MTIINTEWYAEKAEQVLRFHDERSDVSMVAQGLLSAIQEIEYRRDQNRELHQKLTADPESVPAMLDALARHYGVRVAPVDEYCRAFYDWRDAIEANVKELEASLDQHSCDNCEGVDPTTCMFNNAGELTRWREVLQALDALLLPILKSNYLARRIYGGEPHRTEKCPVHQGRWSGCSWSDQPCECQRTPNGYDSNVTGWLLSEA